MIEGYRALPGVPDELVDQGGRIRPLWRALTDHLAALDAASLAGRLSRGRPVPARCRRLLPPVRRRRTRPSAPGRSAMCRCCSARPIATRSPPRLIQRADLLEAVMADLYGTNQLVAAGPPAARADRVEPRMAAPAGRHPPALGPFPAFRRLRDRPRPRRQVVGARPTAPRRRRARAIALENRVATSRAFSELYAQVNVHRLAGFFREFKEALTALGGDRASDRDGGAAILTPRPAERDLLRTRLYRPLPRDHAGAGRGHDGRPGAAEGAHRFGAAAGRRAVAAARCRALPIRSNSTRRRASAPRALSRRCARKG